MYKLVHVFHAYYLLHLCYFRALAYITLGRLYAVFLYTLVVLANMMMLEVTDRNWHDNQYAMYPNSVTKL